MFQAKILIIDDDVILAKSVAKRLDKNGYEVYIEYDGESALRRLVLEKFDLILLDIKMPKMSGLQVLDTIRKSFEKNILPVIMFSCIHDEKEIVKAIQNGANDYITKPVNKEILLARIATHIEVVNLSNEYTFRKQVEAIAAMITTYKHEINNALTVSFSCYEKAKAGKLAQRDFAKFEKSLQRIRKTVKLLDKISEDKEIEFEIYSGASKKIKMP